MEERHEIVGLARQVGGEGFDNMEPDELDALIASHAEELTEENMKPAVMRKKRCQVLR